MSQASIAAYLEILPSLGRREKAVLQTVVEFGPMTNRQIASHLGIERDSVSPRTGSLKNKGLLVEAGILGRETVYNPVDPGLVQPKKRKSSRQELHTALTEIVHYFRRATMVSPELAQGIKAAEYLL